MKKTMRSLQKGRSMLEVIAILGVMGILLIAGMVGFKILLDYLKQKETIEQIATIGMRYKAERLKGTSVETKYVPSKQFYPEGNNCGNGTKIDCVTTPEGGNVHLFSIADSKNFVVFTTFNNARTCEEVALMGGYEYAFGLKEKLPEGNAIQKGHDEFFLNKDQGRDPEQTFTHYPTKEQNASQIINSAGESFSFSADYLKKNPNALKVFCDTNIPLGFVYTAGDCKFMCGGVCQSCPCNQVEDNEGTCCKEADIKCGTCGGCKGGKRCLTDDASDPFSGRCVQCIENSHCNTGNNEYCQNNKCVECTGPYYELKNDPDSGEKICECKELKHKLNENCDADCNCAQGLFCYEDPTTFAKTCKECLIQPDCPGNVPCVDGQCKCDDVHHPCPPGQVCCNKTCCPAGQFCKAGVCSTCTENPQCGSNSECCEGVCCAEGARCCNKQCCNKRCITVDGQETCGGCVGNEDCPDNEYCDTTEHVCKPCLNEALKTCDNSVTENFNTKCYTKKHLNCLDTTDTKDVPGLIQSAPNVNTPICANGAAETDATCNPCTSTAQCQALEGNGDRNRTLLRTNTSTKVDGVLFKDFVCRRNHSGADAQYNGSCGPCIDNTDCEGGVPCLDGKCGCQAHTDCAGNIDGTKCLTTNSCDCQSDADCMTEDHLTTGQTKCVTGQNGVGTCGCDDGLVFNQTLGYCVCSTANEFWTRYTENNASNQKYLCCEQGLVATMVGNTAMCLPMCETDEYISVAMMLDYSWSGRHVRMNNTTFDSARTNLANAFINGLKQINSDIRFGVFREDNNHETNTNSPQKCQGSKNKITIQNFSTGTPDLNQDLCSYSTEKGLTAFTEAINKIQNECKSNKEKTIVFVLSDGIIPTNTATATGCDSKNMYVYAAGEKSFGLGGMPHEMQFTATPDSGTLLNMVSDKICVNPQRLNGKLQPEYNPENS